MRPMSVKVSKGTTQRYVLHSQPLAVNLAGCTGGVRGSPSLATGLVAGPLSCRIDFEVVAPILLMTLISPD